MKSIIRYLAIKTMNKKLKKVSSRIPDDKFQQEVQKSSVEYSHLIKESIFMIIGVLSATFGLKGFLLPNSFIDGGITGVSLIINELSNVPISILLIAINLPFLLLGFKAINKSFAIRSIISISMLAIAVELIDFPMITDDKLLISIFGGFFLGLGIGMSIRGGAVLDGTEVLAIFASKKTGLTIGDIITVVNVVIFLIASFVFSVEIALYAMITYLAASKTVDFVVDGLEEFIGVTIISEQNEDIRKAIIERVGRGCTIYKGKGGYDPYGVESNEVDIIYTLITRLELARLQTEVDIIDPNAFMIMHSIKDARGGMIRKGIHKK